jgi:hypothetical protein
VVTVYYLKRYKVKSSLFYSILAVLVMLAVVILPGCGNSPPAATSTPNPTTTATSSATTQTTPTTTEPPTDLTVLSIAGGSVEVLKAGAGDWKKGEEGMTLEAGDKIRTNAGGTAVITFFEGSTVELQGDTAISLSELGMNADRSTTVRVKQEIGKTISRAKKLMDTGDRYEIETPAAVAAVRGTIMFVQVGFSGLTFVGNIEGTVEVTAQGIVVHLAPDTHTNIIPGQDPGTPLPGATPSGTTTTSTTSTTISTTTTTTSTSTSTSTTTTSTLPPLRVEITSVQQGDLVGRDVVVSGTVNDPTITEAVLTLNGQSSTISVNNGSFSAAVTLADGNNRIVITVTRGADHASASIELAPE